MAAEVRKDAGGSYIVTTAGGSMKTRGGRNDGVNMLASNRARHNGKEAARDPGRQAGEYS